MVINYTAFASPLLGSQFVNCSSQRLPSEKRVQRQYKTNSIVAAARRRRTQNVSGNVFVDDSCIDCDLCRWIAPDTFHRSDGQSAVHSQPSSADSRLHAMLAAVTCPTGSIRTEKLEPQLREAANSFPFPTQVPGVYFNGNSAQQTFGACSWLVIDKNMAVMFDCPRYSTKLASSIEKATEAVGGVKYLVLSHRDDVHGHQKWAERLSAERVIHVDEMNRYQGTDACEIPLTDDQFPYELAPGFQLIHVPGHTGGSIAMLHTPSSSLFTGDHISARSNGKLMASRTLNFYSWNEQIESVRKLKDVPFLHIWPGHGRQLHFETFEEKDSAILDAVDRMKQQ